MRPPLTAQLPPQQPPLVALQLLLSLLLLQLSAPPSISQHELDTLFSSECAAAAAAASATGAGEESSDTALTVSCSDCDYLPARLGANSVSLQQAKEEKMNIRGGVFRKVSEAAHAHTHERARTLTRASEQQSDSRALRLCLSASADAQLSARHAGRTRLARADAGDGQCMQKTAVALHLWL